MQRFLHGAEIGRHHFVLWPIDREIRREEADHNALQSLRIHERPPVVQDHSHAGKRFRQRGGQSCRGVHGQQQDQLAMRDQ